MSDYDDLLTDDLDWVRSFSASLKILEDWSAGQLAIWPVDDLLGSKSYVPCPRRGLHAKITECGLCYGDWAWGKATAEQVLAPREAGGAA